MYLAPIFFSVEISLSKFYGLHVGLKFLWRIRSGLITFDKFPFACILPLLEVRFMDGLLILRCLQEKETAKSLLRGLRAAQTGFPSMDIQHFPP